VWNEQQPQNRVDAGMWENRGNTNSFAAITAGALRLSVQTLYYYLTRNSAITDKPHHAFVQYMQWRE